MALRRNMDMQIGALTMSMAHNSMTEPSPGLRNLDPDTDFKVRRITAYINEAIHTAANEPSLGLYRIQEHVHRTAPQLVVRKKDLKANNKQIEEKSYDLNLSMDVVDSMKTITNFTRIQEVLKTAIEMKRKLNIEEEDEKARREHEMKNAKIANRSLSCNEPAEGYICPVCYYALTGQDALIAHWQEEHNLDDCENETFHEVEMPGDDVGLADETLEEDDDITVIISPQEHEHASLEAVGKGFLDSGCNYFEQNENTASDASGSLEDQVNPDNSRNEIYNVDVLQPEVMKPDQSNDVNIVASNSIDKTSEMSLPSYHNEEQTESIIKMYDEICDDTGTSHEVVDDNKAVPFDDNTCNTEDNSAGCEIDSRNEFIDNTDDKC